jgi:hypothetical protein
LPNQITRGSFRLAETQKAELPPNENFDELSQLSNNSYKVVKAVLDDIGLAGPRKDYKRKIATGGFFVSRGLCISALG